MYCSAATGTAAGVYVALPRPNAESSSSKSKPVELDIVELLTGQLSHVK